MSRDRALPVGRFARARSPLASGQANKTLRGFGEREMDVGRFGPLPIPPLRNYRDDDLGDVSTRPERISCIL